MKTNENTKAVYLDADNPDGLVKLINGYLSKYSIIQIDYTHIEGRYGAYVIYETRQPNATVLEKEISDTLNYVKYNE